MILSQHQILLPATTYGVTGACCTSFSFGDCVGAYLSMLEAVERNDLAQARKDQRLIAEKCARLGKGNYFAGIKTELTKELLASEGLDFGVPRSPVWIE